MRGDRSLILVFIQHLCTVFLEGRRDGVRLIGFEKQQVMTGTHFMESVVHMELLRYPVKILRRTHISRFACRSNAA